MITRSFFRFNTSNTISAETDDERILDDALALCDRYEHLFSRFHPESQLYRINHAHGKPCEVDAELASLIETALTYCHASQGLFDITMGSVSALWDFKRGVVADADAVADALQHVDYRTVSVCGTTVTLRNPKASLDVGGIAKGYIADAVLRLLKERGVEHAVVNLGGNVAVMGGKPDASLWRIGIRKPQHSQTMPVMEYFATVSLNDGSVVTSGVYERAFMRNKVLYHHILDPQTGFPAQTDLLSATVISQNSIDGDGYTTALIIMGADRALAFACEHPDIEVILVTCEGDVLATPAVGTSIPFQITA